MSELLRTIQAQVSAGDWRVTLHARKEADDDRIFLMDVIFGIQSAVVVEEYPTHSRGPCMLVLEYDRDDIPLHAVWGLPAGRLTPATLITVYRPDPNQWTTA
jgi:hypothetical protein